ncbi:MAG: glycosyltransferase family 2 protein [Gemmatimonadaceae bacterium]|nr:glycosyltransferase family 2 protein [Gemmatimonadaceae bacterium]
MSHSSSTPRVPLVSVLMTAYNREAYIAQSIDSVLRSTLDDLELVVVDNCSSDRTVAIARDYRLRDARVRVFQNESNIGDFPNRNRAAGHALGAYLKYVDSDDLIYPHGLEVMVRCMEAFPEAGLGLSSVPDTRGPCPLVLSSAAAYREHFFHADLLSRAPGSAIIRRSAFQAVGGFSGRRYIGDVELWLKLASRFAVVKMPTDLLWDRQHAGQEQHTQDRVEWIAMREDEEIAALRAEECPLSETERDAALARVSSKRARNYWLFLRGKGGIQLAGRYRRRASLATGAIARFAWKRLRPDSRTSPSQSTSEP